MLSTYLNPISIKTRINIASNYSWYKCESVTITGTNLAGTVEIVHNGSGSGNEDLVTITYVGTPFDNSSFPILYPANPATAALTGDRQVFAVGTALGFKIKTGIDRPFANTYKWNYHVIGN